MGNERCSGARDEESRRERDNRGKLLLQKVESIRTAPSSRCWIVRSFV